MEEYDSEAIQTQAPILKCVAGLAHRMALKCAIDLRLASGGAERTEPEWKKPPLHLTTDSNCIQTCSECGGRGGVMKTQRTPFGVMSQLSSCFKCNGYGKAFIVKARLLSICCESFDPKGYQGHFKAILKKTMPQIRKINLQARRINVEFTPAKTIGARDDGVVEEAEASERRPEKSSPRIMAIDWVEFMDDDDS
ncbi:hypothetical protein ACFE04_024568 [Oxalis oulophora]